MSVMTNTLKHTSRNHTDTFTQTHTPGCVKSPTYTRWSICVAPASGAVWFAPAPSSDTGTWLSPHWFSADGAPAVWVWHWRTPPPDTQTEDRLFLYTFIYLEKCAVEHMWLCVSGSLIKVHTVTYIHSSSALGVTAVECLRTPSSLTEAVGG